VDCHFSIMNQTARHIPTLIPEPRFLYVKTFGCQMNEYDSLRVQRLLHAQGYLLTSDMASADVIFLNTCSVREKAEQKVHSFLGRLRRLKEKRPHLKIVVAGCVAQQLGKQLLERFEYLDLVLGTRGIAAITELLQELHETGGRRAYLPEEESPRSPSEQQLTWFPESAALAAPVTIMQGCDNYCTYCIVPYVRGRERSRPMRDVIEEIQSLTQKGVREILLLGQNVNSYGQGLDEKTCFAELLRRVQSETDVRRLRFTTSHPKDLNMELIQCFADLPCLCRALHLPVQAGSDVILSRMNRGYTAADYLAKITLLRQVCPDIGLSSDVMVGFPGETEDDFRQTIQLLEAVQFDNLFSFRYSDRPYAQSSTFQDKVDEPIKAQRLLELQSLQSEITLQRNRMEVGAIREILVEGPSRASNGQLTGRTQQNRVINFVGSKELIGETIYVKITSAFAHSLKGEIEHPGAHP
jgi:tRNA-2-methylthio-N6-dimethylallyladenosine synthase